VDPASRVVEFESLGTGVRNTKRFFVSYPIPEREFFIDGQLVRIHLITDMILVDRPRTMGV